MKRVLLVSYPFFPSYHVGVRRVAQLCRHLPAFGWEPIVLTKDWDLGRMPEDDFFGTARSDDMLAEIGYAPIVVRAKYEQRANLALRTHRRLQRESPSLSRAVRPARVVARKVLSAFYPAFGDWPDRFVGWIPHAEDAGVRAVQQYGVDRILSICPPQTAHLAAARISRRSGRPWVAAFDDLFGFYVGPNDWHRTRAQRAAALHANRRVLRGAAAVSANTPSMLEYLRRVYGVDGAVSVPGYADVEVAPQLRGDKMRVAYTGSIYPETQRPQLFFDALDGLIARDERAADDVEVCLMGTRADDALRALLAGRPCSRLVKIVAHSSGAEALSLQQSAHVLLMLNLVLTDPAIGTLSFPSKTYEYLAARRPVLAMPGDIGGWGNKVLTQTNAGKWADTADAGTEFLAAALAQWRTKGRVDYGGVESEIERFSARAQSRGMADLLDGAPDGRRARRFSLP